MQPIPLENDCVAAFFATVDDASRIDRCRNVLAYRSNFKRCGKVSFTEIQANTTDQACEKHIITGEFVAVKWL
jgi:hypothetical protein